MFDLSPEKVLLVLVIALVVLGPNRLPQAARALGRFVANLRQMSSTVQGEVRDALAEPREAFNGALGDVELSDIRDSVEGAVRPIRSALHPMRETVSPPAAGAETAAGAQTADAQTAVTGKAALTGKAASKVETPATVEAGGRDLSSAPMPPPPDDPTLN